MMTFPKTIDEFIDLYQFVDRKEVYTNGSELIQVLRVQQAIEHYLPKWISVKDRLPEEGRRVMVLRRGNIMICNLFTLGWLGWSIEGQVSWLTDDGSFVKYDEVTHWMPLPDPPEVEE